MGVSVCGVVWVGGGSLEREREGVRVSCRSMCDWKGMEETEGGQGTGMLSRKDGLCE